MITSFPPACGGGQEGISTILGHDPPVAGKEKALIILRHDRVFTDL
ncbi:MAG: hypothetical protein LBR79_05175 [Oscillospiraceae bacterium]|nr:hypothetical protein [Oscillospiraceae bacterium]